MNTNKIDLIRAEVERIQLYTQSEVLKQVLDYIDSLQEEPVNYNKLNTMLNDALSKETKESWNERLDKNDFRERYKRIAQSESFKKAYEGISIGDVVPVEGEISEEPSITEIVDKHFWEMLGEKSVSEELEQAVDVYLKSYWGGEKEKQDWPFLKKMAIHFAKWQKEQIEEALLSEVLPCFMHGGEADEVVAKLDEVLNKKK